MKIYAVIVCYNPDLSVLCGICRHLICNGCTVVLVDNSEKCYINTDKELADCILITNDENTGIASAQNTGINYAIEHNADVIVFFDQDSRIDSDFLPALLASLEPGVPGVVAPVYYDDNSKFEYPSFKLTKYGGTEQVHTDNRARPYSVDIVISSGMAVTVETFKAVGLMDEDLFIDFVDTEWCLRCRKNNIPVRVVPTAAMRHSIGESSKRFCFLTVITHTPVRCYYQIRNCFHLFRKDSIPFLLAVKETLSVFMHKMLLLLFVKNKLAYLSHYTSGMVHGIRGVTGKRSD